MPLIEIDKNLCKGRDCLLCVQFCPHAVLTKPGPLENHPKVENPDNCTICLRCEIHCPDLAISVFGDDE